MENNIDVNQVAQKLLNKLAISEYQQTVLETQNEQLMQENSNLKKKIEDLKSQKEKAGK